MTLTPYSPAGPARRLHSGIAPVGWVVVGVAAMALAGAVEGVVEIGREILGPSPAAPDASSEVSSRPPAAIASHEIAGFFLVAATFYVVRLVRRAMADLMDTAREIGMARK
ncbi:hypothetical protein [Streptacidiphilus rugosus]|uniref:hypothetical protein n=1 Tax=Streptacidiphilus rugosus TaxID=405783 RepID=UPI00055F9DAF|nr:hypothetical protein [Streptacidiphilus rugosus]